jgi:glyoxylase I family protein
MPSFAGVNHVALTVTDLERSTRFYADALGLLPVLDLGHGRVLLDRRSGFSVGLLRHPDAEGGAFTELGTGLDHLGLTAADRDELVAWERHLDSLGVDHSAITDTALGSHLNFRDPDGIALELQAPTAVYVALVHQLGSGEVPDDVLRDQAEALLGPGLVIRP